MSRRHAKPIPDSSRDGHGLSSSSRVGGRTADTLNVTTGGHRAPQPPSSRLSFSPRLCGAHGMFRTAGTQGHPLLGAGCVFHLISQSSLPQSHRVLIPRGPERRQALGVGGRNRVGEKGRERLTINGANCTAREQRGWEGQLGHGASLSPRTGSEAVTSRVTPVTPLLLRLTLCGD